MFRVYINNSMKKFFLTLALLLGALGITLFAVLQMKPFGKNPTGKRLERVQQSPHYRDGKFQNLSETPMMTGDNALWDSLREWVFERQNTEPPAKIPSQKTDLKNLPEGSPQLVWFGHSGYLLKLNSLTIAIDPILAESISPVPGFMNSYNGSFLYTPEDMPPLDAIIITHDHYDHLNYETITALNSRTKRFITALGVGEHLEYWGIEPAKIMELDWWESIAITDSVRLTATPARHFSGRGIINDKTLWASFVLQTPQKTLYLGGDSGYDSFFKTIGEKFPGIDLAIMECGQYNKKWALIHFMPEETVQAALDLGAKALMPVHWGRFTLASHLWNEPIERAANEAHKSGLPLCTPQIGERVELDKTLPNKQWWKLVLAE